MGHSGSFSFRRLSLDQRILDPAPEHGQWHGTGLARDHLAPPQQHQRRDGLHGEPLLQRPAGDPALS